MRTATKDNPTTWPVRALGPNGLPKGPAIGHVEDYGSDVPQSERYAAFWYRPLDAVPMKVGTSGIKALAMEMVRRAAAD